MAKGLDDKAKTKPDLLAEVAALRARVAELEAERTARRSAEAALRESREQFRALIDATAEDVVVLLDADHRTLIVNERMAKGFGKAASELLGKRIDELVPTPVGSKRQAMQEQVLREGKHIRFEDERNGRWFDNNMCPVFGPDGKANGVAIFARDITERKQIEKALAAAKEEAEKANRAKSHFLAAANHDLRQPLQAMSLLLGALSYAGLGDDGEDIATDMANALQVMEGLLNALLDISKLDAGILVPNVRDFHLVPFLCRMHNQFRAQAKEQGVQMRVFPANALVRTDSDLLARIVQNFISNAIRHTRGGEMLLGCRRAAGAVRVEVWDRGPGIASEQLDRVFDEFYQIGEVARSLHQGLGLGLAIASRIADLLGLRIGVKSKPGRGSVFFIELPLAGVSAHRPGTQQCEYEPGGRVGGSVLLVEDDDTVRNATARLLRLWGLHPLCAASAEDAYEVVLSQPETPVLALVDFRLQRGSNGIELLTGLRENLGLDVPAILLTGDTEPDRLKQARASGYRMLHKPVSPDDLRSALLEDAAFRPQFGDAVTDNQKNKTEEQVHGPTHPRR